MAEQPGDGKKGENREDFMKRWFAIALSVGFATALSRMPWISEGLIFKPELAVDPLQVNQGFRLLAAAIATLLSWEGYLWSIQTKPLTDGRRFYIDVTLVTLYLVLLLTSASPYLWLWIHCLTFVIYIFWDWLSIAAFPNAYTVNNDGSRLKRSQIYRSSFSGDGAARHGPLVTAIWPIYFITLAASYQWQFSVEEKSSPIVTASYFIMVLYGLLGYRGDKGNSERRPLRRLGRVCLSALIALGVSFVLQVVEVPVRSFVGL